MTGDGAGGPPGDDGPRELSDALIAEIRGRFAADRRVRRTLPAGGRINIDRRLPFLVVYRPVPGRADPATRRLVTGEAAYLVAPGGQRHQARLHSLLRGLAHTAATVFGGYLVIELWAGVDAEGGSPPGFTVVADRDLLDSPVGGRLAASLGQVRLGGRRAEVGMRPDPDPAPPGMQPLLTATEAEDLGVRLVGVEVRPVHRDPASGDAYPEVRRQLQRQLAPALRRAAFAFARGETAHPPAHHQALGRRVFTRAVGRADRDLAGIAGAFDLLLAVSPVDADAAYRRFAAAGHAVAPAFRYRALTVDPSLLKRRLFAIPLEHVEDPTMAQLLTAKRRELDLQLSILGQRGTDRALPLSIALHGTVEDDLLRLARDLLERLPPPGRRQEPLVDARELARRAEQELSRYRHAHPDGRVEVRDDVSTLMVSHGDLLVGSGLRVRADRVEALIQHEVGTHVVSHVNASEQPFRLLTTGLPGSETCQEGLAVLAEHLVGGLTAARLRTLAGRVVGARTVVDGASFVDTYRELVDGHGFGSRSAFRITTRLHRGGGFVKDAVYLRGLRQVMAYLAGGGEPETLLVGKIGLEHVGLVVELGRRGVLEPVAVRPGWLDDTGAAERLTAVRDGRTVGDLAGAAGRR